MNKRHLLAVAALLLASWLPSTYDFTWAQSKTVLVVSVTDYISPATAELVSSAIKEASSQRDYTAVLLLIDTFGGLMDSMFSIVNSIQESRVPVIGYVHPPGRQALSAGTYILLAADYAAMAPHTTIGSAQPIQGTTPINDSKIINALAEKMTSLAKLHNRNATQASRFVTHNDNLDSQKALERRVIEAIASTPRDLLEEAHGKKVSTIRGEVTLDTKGVELRNYEQGIRVAVLKILSDPIISNLLTVVGFFVLILGLVSPGFGAEVGGAILILLGLAGQGFNANYVAIALLAIGAGLIVYELHTPSFGAFGLGGIIALAIGVGLSITQPPAPLLVSQAYVEQFLRATAIILSALGAVFGVLVYKAGRILKMKRLMQPRPTGEGRSVDNLGPGLIGYVVVDGEYWQAESDEPIEAGSRVKVTDSSKKTLKVKRT